MFENKLIAVINRQIEPGVAMNACAHMCIGLGANLGSESIQSMDYHDAEGNIYPNISKIPFIIVQAKNSNRIRKLITEAEEEGIRYTAFTDTMTVGSWEEQKQKTVETNLDDLLFYGVVLFGKHDIVSELTKRFSILKSFKEEHLC